MDTVQRTTETFPENRYAKDAWVEAWLEGNRQTPQNYLAIQVYLLAAILEDQSLDMDEFLQRDRYEFLLTSAQLNKAKQAMNGWHRASSIGVHTRDYAEKLLTKGISKPRIIEDKSIVTTWDGSTHLIEKFARLMNRYDYKKNPQMMADFKMIVFKIREIFRSPAFKALADEYKKTFGGNLDYLQKQFRKAHFFQQVDLLVQERLSKELPPLSISEELAFKLFDILGLNSKKPRLIKKEDAVL